MDDALMAIRTEFRQASLAEILHAPPRAVLGVTPAAEKVLAELGIESVFDLATSAVFGAAATLLDAGADLGSAMARHGAATSDIVRESVTSGKPLAEIPYMSIAALEDIPSTKARAIAEALDATTVRDLALYPPFRVARALLRSLYFPETDPLFDPERPADLLPSSGNYPTERVQYQTVLMDASDGDVAGLVEVTSDGFGPVDLAALAAGDAGFKKVAFGALLTYTQSWFSQGVTLGQLLHSVALAPGESTRIAVVDWTRRSRAGETETISEEDQLANETSHNRAISEVTNAVATEAQNGFSHSSTQSDSTEVGVSYAVDVSSPLGGLLGGVGVSKGGSGSTASASGTADSYSSSFGQRTVGSSMAQNVADRTHQNAHSSRTRRASVVKEVAQSEHESVSTRVIANYNHMHALTVQYYEVVQVHRVDLVLSKAERVIFIPVKLMDFTDERLVRRFRAVLWRAALTTAIRSALADLDVIEIAPDRKQTFPGLGHTVESYLGLKQSTLVVKDLKAQTLEMKIASAVAKEVAKERAKDPKAPAAEEAVDAGAAAELAVETWAAERTYTGRASKAAVLLDAYQAASDELWDLEQSARLSNLVGQAILRPDSVSMYLPTDVSIERAFVDGGGAVVIPVFTLRSGAVDTTVSAGDPIALSDVTRIDLRGASPEGDVEARLTLTLNRNGVRFPVQLPAVTIPQGRRTDTPLVTVRANAVDVNLARHLADNQLYYSQAVLRSLDAAQLALLLSNLSIAVETEGDAGATVTRTVPVAQVIDPIPMRIVGNYLAFRMSVDVAYDLKWKRWLDDHGVEVGRLYDQDIVPLGTGGVFAEAVLGRSNSAEKLDITRFWDWQDSPIPLQPTEIAAIQTGSRGTVEDISPGQLSNPIVNITSPTSLPDPVGTAAILQAIQNGGMFRDMSGLQATIGLLQSGIEQTMAGASAAGQQAGENMNNLLRATTERQRIGAELVSSLAQTAASAYTGGAIPPGGKVGGGGGGGGASQQGAKINYFDKTAKTGAPAGGTPTGAGAQGGGAAPGTPAGGSSGGGQPSSPPTTYSQNPAALESVWGNSKSPSETAETLIDKVGLTGSGAPANPPATPGALEARRAWPILDPDAVLSRIEELRLDPDQFDYSYFGLCPAGTFLRNVAAAKPAEFNQFAKELFASGMAFLGSRKVSPSPTVRNLDYGELAVMRVRPMPPQADWMLMVGLRDSESFLTVPEGMDARGALELASREFAEFHASTGWYSDVRQLTDTSPTAMRNLPGDADTEVTIWLRTRADLVPAFGPVRMLTLDSGLLFDDTGTKEVMFGYWAYRRTDGLVMKIPEFEAAYLGATVAVRA